MPLRASDCLLVCEMGEQDRSTRVEGSLRWVPGSVGSK